MRSLSIGQAAGISAIVRRAFPCIVWAWASVGLPSLMAAGCDMRSLKSSDLFHTRDAGTDRTNDSATGPEASVDGRPEAPTDDGPASADVDPADAAPDALDVGTVDAGCPAVCPSGQYCDDALDRCVSSTGTGMLSGTVRDSCGRTGIDALVGIAGRHTCSYVDKGSYFFPNLPLGTLKIAAAKDGYALYDATIVVAAGGTIHDIVLVPASADGCAALPAPPVACTCATATCER